MLKSDQDGIESAISIISTSYHLPLKSDQDGIESNIWEGLATSLLMLKSDQDGIEIKIVVFACILSLFVEIRPR